MPHYIKDLVCTSTPYIDSKAYNSLADAITAIGSKQATLLITDDKTVSSDLTIPSNITLSVSRGHPITIASGITLTIGSFDGQGRLWQMFTGGGYVKLDTEDWIYPQWFGAFPQDSSEDLGNDYTTQINKAISSLKLGQGLYFSAGNWYCNIMTNNAKFSIQGAASKLTRIYNPKTDGTPVISFNWTGLSIDYARRDYTIAGLEIEGTASTGDGIYLEQIANLRLEDLSINCPGGHGIHARAAQWLTIKSVNLFNCDFYGKPIEGVGYNMLELDNMEIVGSNAGFYLERGTNVSISRLVLEGINNAGTGHDVIFCLSDVTNAKCDGLWFEQITPNSTPNHLIELRDCDTIEFNNIENSVEGLATTIYLRDVSYNCGNITINNSLFQASDRILNNSKTGVLVFKNTTFKKFAGVQHGAYQIWSPSFTAANNDWLITRNPKYQEISSPNLYRLQHNLVQSDSNFDHDDHMSVVSGNGTVQLCGDSYFSKTSVLMQASGEVVYKFDDNWLSAVDAVSDEYVAVVFMAKGFINSKWTFTLYIGGIARDDITVTMPDIDMWQQYFIVTKERVSGTVGMTITSSSDSSLFIDNIHVFKFPSYHPSLIDDFVYDSVGMPEVSSASTLSLGGINQLYGNAIWGQDTFYVTGTTNIASIDSESSIPGRTVVLVFADALTVIKGNNLLLSSDFSTSANSTITLRCDGVNWYELSRS